MVFQSGISNTYHPVSVDFITSSYRVVGKVLVSHTGVLGIVTDINSSVIEVHDAQLARLDMPTRLADRFEIARIVKSQVVAVCVNRRDDLGPSSFSAYSNVTTYPLRIITPIYEVHDRAAGSRS
jgi:hypothetical protein